MADPRFNRFGVDYGTAQDQERAFWDSYAAASESAGPKAEIRQAPPFSLGQWLWQQALQREGLQFADRTIGRPTNAEDRPMAVGDFAVIPSVIRAGDAAYASARGADMSNTIGDMTFGLIDAIPAAATGRAAVRGILSRPSIGEQAAQLIADETGGVPIGRQGSAPPRAPSQMMNLYENRIEDVPIDFLEGIRGNKLRYDTADLEASIAREGIREPLIIMVGKDSRTAVLGEGNHRLQALRNLGYDSAPVRVIVGREYGRDNGVTFDDLIPKSGEYFSADAKPSDVFGRFAGTRQAMDTEQPVRPQNRPSGLLSLMEQ